MPEYSVIIPVYNRPDEVDELLESLTGQTFKDFEVLIIEDGSVQTCEQVVHRYARQLDVTYHAKSNSGQGFSRNYGLERAKGKWLIVFDSDCLIPPRYFEIVHAYLQNHSIDAYGGSDRAHEDFTEVQKAISYAMTSLFTTGGIRGNKRHLGVFHPRSFNMGIRREVFEKTGGYLLPKKGEDIEFSIRIIANGYRTALIEDAYVYHKRRTNFRQYYRQLHFFGTARINIFRYYPSELKAVHFFPSLFTMGWMICTLLLFTYPPLGAAGLFLYGLYFFLLLVDASIQLRSFRMGMKALLAAIIQLSAYGLGFMQEGWLYLRKR